MLYLIFLLIIFIMMIYLSIYINYKIEKQNEYIKEQKKPLKKQIFSKLQFSPDQTDINYKYNYKKHNWGKCDNIKNHTTTKVKYWI